MLKILQARLQQYTSHEIPDVQAGFRKGKGTRDQIANICWIIKKASEFQKNIYFCLIDYAKAFDCVDHNKLWKLLKEIGICAGERSAGGGHWGRSRSSLRSVGGAGSCARQVLVWDGGWEEYHQPHDFFQGRKLKFSTKALA